jgi:SH3-like domain-containing protein
MKARIIDPQVKVYSSMDGNDLSIATLQQGSEIEFRRTKRKGGKLWVPITLSTGQQAFIPAETHIFVIREGALMQNNVDLHSEPSAESPIKQQLARNARLSILEVIKGAEQDWVRVRDASGNEGFIAGDTRVRLTQQRSKANGRRSMITGGMWLVAGLIFLFSDSSATSSSGINIIGIAALAFGLVIFISGLVQFVTASS